MVFDLTGQRLGQADDAVFGDAVGPEADIGHQAGKRCGERDMATRTLLEQPRQKRLDSMDGAPQVDIDHPAPVVMRHLRDRTRDDNAGVAEDDVDLAEKPKCLVRKVNHLIEMSDVAHHGVRVKPLGMQVCHRLLQRRLIDVGEHNACSTASQLGGSSEPDAIRTAGDDGSFSFEPTFETVHGARRYAVMESSASRVSRSTNAAEYRCANARQISGRCHASPPLSVAIQIASPCATDAR